jgi:hypothetical protein
MNAGTPVELDLRLTPLEPAKAASDAARPRDSAGPPDQQRGGNRGSRVTRWLALAGGVAAAGGGIAILAKGSNHPPTARFTLSPSEGYHRQTLFTFNATGSTDPDDDPLTYHWDFGDGAAGSGAQATHTFVDSGYFTVTLSVSDSRMSSTAQQSVRVHFWVADTVWDFGDTSFWYYHIRVRFNASGTVDVLQPPDWYHENTWTQTGDRLDARFTAGWFHCTGRVTSTVLTNGLCENPTLGVTWPWNMSRSQ